jgi:hypothetical protein
MCCLINSILSFGARFVQTPGEFESPLWFVCESAVNYGVRAIQSMLYRDRKGRRFTRRAPLVEPWGDSDAPPRRQMAIARHAFMNMHSCLHARSMLCAQSMLCVAAPAAALAGGARDPRCARRRRWRRPPPPPRWRDRRWRGPRPLSGLQA